VSRGSLARTALRLVDSPSVGRNEEAVTDWIPDLNFGPGDPGLAHRRDAMAVTLSILWRFLCS
jgi:hypothetical protein